MSFRTRVGLACALAGCQASVPPTLETGAPRSERHGELVDIGGRSLFLDCGGTGTPTVVLEAGGGGNAAGWQQVLPELRRSTRVCAYDRAGTGLSAAAPRPHTLRQMVDELETLLTQASLASPYVLVGHSLGGLLVRLYASEHLQAVGGLVLVDPTTEEQDTRMWNLLPPALLHEFKRNLSESPEGLDYDSFVAGMAELRSADRSLGGLPLIVLTAVGEQAPEPGVSTEAGEQIAREWLAMHEEVGRFSSNSAHIVIEKSGHDIANEAPSVVVAAIQEVLASATTNRPIAAENVRSVARAIRR